MCAGDKCVKREIYHCITSIVPSSEDNKYGNYEAETGCSAAG